MDTRTESAEREAVLAKMDQETLGILPTRKLNAVAEFAFQQAEWAIFIGLFHYVGRTQGLVLPQLVGAALQLLQGICIANTIFHACELQFKPHRRTLTVRLLIVLLGGSLAFAMQYGILQMIRAIIAGGTF